MMNPEDIILKSVDSPELSRLVVGIETALGEDLTDIYLKYCSIGGIPGNSLEDAANLAGIISDDLFFKFKKEFYAIGDDIKVAALTHKLGGSDHVELVAAEPYDWRSPDNVQYMVLLALNSPSNIDNFTVPERLYLDTGAIIYLEAISAFFNKGGYPKEETEFIYFQITPERLYRRELQRPKDGDASPETLNRKLKDLIEAHKFKYDAELDW